MKGIGTLAEKLPAVLERWKYPALLLLLGLALVLWPSGKREAETPTEPTAAAESAEDFGEDYRLRTEKELAALLSQMEGAGRVKVMLTLKTGPAAHYQTDRSTSRGGAGDRETAESEERTVILDRGSAYDEPALVSTAYPVFQGALILAEGASDPTVRYQLSAAVAALLGLGADQITVVKMK